MPDLKVLLSRETIAKRVAELGEEIASDFQGQSIIFVGVLKGAAIFLSDLARQVPLDATFDFIGVSSYGNRPIAKEDPGVDHHHAYPHARRGRQSDVCRAN